MSFQGISKYN